MGMGDRLTASELETVDVWTHRFQNIFKIPLPHDRIVRASNLGHAFAARLWRARIGTDETETTSIVMIETGGGIGFATLPMAGIIAFVGGTGGSGGEGSSRKDCGCGGEKGTRHQRYTARCSAGEDLRGVHDSYDVSEEMNSGFTTMR